MKQYGRAKPFVVAFIALFTTAACTAALPATAPTDIATTEGAASGHSPRIQEALAVATVFTQARSDRDIEAMAANSIEGFINGLVVLSLEQMPAEFAWQEAVGWTIEVEGCEVTEVDETTPTIRCDVIHDNAISQALDVEPYRGSYHIKVLFAGDEMLGIPITSTTVSESHQTEFPIFNFTTETWRPFVAWLEDNHPEDMALMLGSAVEPGVEFMLVAGEQKPALNEDSIQLWSKHTAEFAGAHNDR